MPASENTASGLFCHSGYSWFRSWNAATETVAKHTKCSAIWNKTCLFVCICHIADGYENKPEGLWDGLTSIQRETKKRWNHKIKFKLAHNCKNSFLCFEFPRSTWSKSQICLSVKNETFIEYCSPLSTAVPSACCLSPVITDINLMNNKTRLPGWQITNFIVTRLQ